LQSNSFGTVAVNYNYIVSVAKKKKKKKKKKRENSGGWAWVSDPASPIYFGLSPIYFGLRVRFETHRYALSLCSTHFYFDI
jgi:hypothetical protein